MHSTCLVVLIIATIMSISMVTANPTFGHRYNRFAPYGRGYRGGYRGGYGGYGLGYGGYGLGYGRGYGGLYRRGLEERDFNQDRSNDALPLSDDWMYDQDIQTQPASEDQNQPTEEFGDQAQPVPEQQQPPVQEAPVPASETS